MSSANSTSIKKDERAPVSAGLLVAILIGAFATGIAAKFLGAALPVALATVIAALVPRRHGWNVRAPIAIMAGPLALFVVRALPRAGRWRAPPPDGGGQP